MIMRLDVSWYLVILNFCEKLGFEKPNAWFSSSKN